MEAHKKKSGAYFMNQFSMNKLQDKYRIPSARAGWWDYSGEGSYFLTIVTHHREHSFGTVCNKIMELSHIGESAQQFWMDIPTHFPSVKLGSFVVMPNHIHGILNVENGITSKTNVDDMTSVETLHARSKHESINTSEIKNQSIGAVDCNEEGELYGFAEETLHATSLRMTAISPKAGSLARIIGSYKSAVSKCAHITDAEFEWQERFHDHIILDANELNRIEHYIQHNPENWVDDCYCNPIVPQIP